jgi:predicted RNase H-like nuclease
VDWEAATVAGGEADAGALLASAAALAPGADVRVVAVDMPLARDPIARRRPCDDALSRAYGARGLGVHTPSAARPGPVSDRLHRAFAARGFALATAATPRPPRSVIEVYPHAALVALTGSDYRLAYKASRARRYWPALAPEERRARLLAEWRRILRALATRIADVDLPLPHAAPRAGRMKRYEDALDGVVCAFAGIAFLEGHAVAYGDADAAIWTP